MTKRLLVGLLRVGAAMVVAVGQAKGQVVPATSGDASARVAAEVLSRKISLKLEHVTLRVAIDEIAEKARVRIAYSRTYVPLESQVSLVVDSITVGDALTVLLRGTGIAVAVSPGGALMLDRASEAGNEVIGVRGAQPGGGTITGAIADTITRQSVPYVTVSLDDGTQSVRAGAQGQYTITGVAAGEHRVTAKRVGFIPKTRTVVVEEGKTVTLDFVINRPPTKLDEVVTSAVGDQRRYQVGNVIATVNVDSIAPTAPATSLTDLLTGRVSGLSIEETGGLTGSGEAIRIRGQSSLLLQGDPIIIVDGIREDNTPGGSTGPTFYASRGPSRINDLDFSQIETIDVLKGPAASTEYGTDAANGVIVITTKRGTSGKALWNASAEQEWSALPSQFPEFYYSWGHTTPGAPSVVECPLVAPSGFSSSTSGTCAVDSVTHFDPLNHPAYSLYGTGLRNKYDLSVSGGSEAIRYFLAGGLSNETGIARLPSVFRPEAQALGFPGSADNPNTEGQRSGRANSAIRLSSTADLSVTAAYMSTDAVIPGIDQSGPASSGSSLPDSAHNFGYGYAATSPLRQAGTTYSQQTDRLTAGMTLSWRPNAWLAVHGTIGIDHGSQQTEGLVLPQAVLAVSGDTNQGQLSQGEFGTDIYSADLRASAIAPITHWLRAVTSMGVQLADERMHGLTAIASSGIAATNLTLDGAQNLQVAQASDRTATLGGYVEEQLGFAERLFVIGAMRIDGGSGFGNSIHVTPYPKVSASWLAVTNGPTTVRLRGAIGVAGQQPTNGAALELATLVSNVYVNGGTTSGYQITTPGNPLLKPERSAEYEAGIDLGFWGNRVSVEFSGYQKTTQDALYDLNLGWDLNQAVYEENIGEVRNSGMEGTLTAVVLESRPLVWSFTLNGSINHNLLVHLGPGALPVYPGGSQETKAGYPLNGFWGAHEHYADLNHDGIIEPNEVKLDTAAAYLGSSVPTQTASLATHVGLFHNALTVGALFDYHGGYRVWNSMVQGTIGYLQWPEQNIRGEPLWLQARAVAVEDFGNNLTPSGFFEDGTMVRFRELSLSYNLPTTWAHAMHVNTLSLTAALRNLALWTRYSGPDPEVNDGGGFSTTISGTPFINNNYRSNGTLSVPLPRHVVLRLNLGL